MPKYAELVYNGFWFSPEREALQAAVDHTQRYCTGTVRLKLYKVRTHPPMCAELELFATTRGNRIVPGYGVGWGWAGVWQWNSVGVRSRVLVVDWHLLNVSII